MEQGGSVPYQVSWGRGYLLDCTSENSGELVTARSKVASPSSLWGTSKTENKTSSAIRGEGHTMSFRDIALEGQENRRIRKPRSFRKRVDLGLATDVDIQPVLVAHRKRKMGFLKVDDEIEQVRALKEHEEGVAHITLGVKRLRLDGNGSRVEDFPPGSF